MAHKLTEIKLDEVSLVDQGANPGAHIALFKSKGDKMNVEEVKKALEKAEAQVSELTKANGVLEAELAKAKADAETITKAAADAHTAELKKRDEEITKLKADAENSALEAEVNKSFPLTPGTVAEKVQTLKAVKAMPDEVARKAVLKSMADAEARLAELAKEKGHTGADGGAGSDGEAVGKLDALAKKIAADEKITFEKAYNKALDTAEGRKLHAEIREGKQA